MVLENKHDYYENTKPKTQKEVVRHDPIWREERGIPGDYAVLGKKTILYIRAARKDVTGI